MKYQSYHKTIEVTDELEKLYDKQAKIQDKLIHKLFEINKDLTRWDIKKILLKFEDNPSNSSISRALGNLKNQDKIIKTKSRRVGEYKNKYNSIYIYNPNPDPTKVVKSKLYKLSESEVLLIKITIDNYIETKKSDPELKDIIKMLENILQKFSKVK